MEGGIGSSGKMKQRLARMFRSSTLIRSSCSSSSTTTTSIFSSTATATSSRSFAYSASHCIGEGEDDIILSFSSIPSDPSGRRPVPFSLDCSGSCRQSRPSPEPTLQKKERRVRETGALYVTGEGEGRTCPPASPTSPNSYSYCYFKKTSKKLLTNAYGFTSSSSGEDTDDNFRCFSSEGVNKEERFLSSRSFSSDSCGFYQRPKKNKKKRRKGRSSGYQPVVSVSKMEGDGVAVVKTSNDPYGDFRSSMVEMIVERQVFGEMELKRLLQSYLALNSPRNHEAILKAFSDIWEVLFSH